VTAFVVFGFGLNPDGDGDIYPQWALTPAGSTMVIGKVIDFIWMIFNAFLPVVISFIRYKSEPALIFTIDLEKPKIVG
jgi:hypothetical protein